MAFSLLAGFAVPVVAKQSQAYIYLTFHFILSFEHLIFVI